MTDQPNTRWRGAPERDGAPEQDRAAGNADLAVRITGPVQDLDQAWRLAANLSLAALLPEKLRGKKSDVFAMILYGQDLGLSPMQAIQGINVVEGRPSLGAATWSALMQRHGHKVFVPCRVQVGQRVCSRPPEHGMHDPDNDQGHDYAADHDDTRCRMRVIRADGAMFEATWDLGRAVAADLVRAKKMPDGSTKYTARSARDNPLPWELHRKAMLYARAMSEVCRQAAPAVAMGFYSADEAEEIAARERAERVESQRLDIQAPGPEDGVRDADDVAAAVDEVERLISEPPTQAGMPGGGMPDQADDAAEIVTVAGVEHTVTLDYVAAEADAGTPDLYGWSCTTCEHDQPPQYPTVVAAMNAHTGYAERSAAARGSG